MNSQSGTYKYEGTCRCMYQIGKLQPLQVLPCDTCQFRCEEPLVPVGLVQEVSPVPSSLSRMAARSGNTCNLLRIQDAVNSFSTGVPRSTLITEALKDVLTILLTPNKAIIPSLRNWAVKLASRTKFDCEGLSSISRVKRPGAPPKLDHLCTQVVPFGASFTRLGFVTAVDVEGKTKT